VVPFQQGLQIRDIKGSFPVPYPKMLQSSPKHAILNPERRCHYENQGNGFYGYTSGAGDRPGDAPTPDKAQLIAKIIGIIKEIEVYMSEHGFSLRALVEADDFSKLALIRLRLLLNI